VNGKWICLASVKGRGVSMTKLSRNPQFECVGPKKKQIQMGKGKEDKVLGLWGAELK